MTDLFPTLQPDKKPCQGLWDARKAPEPDICEKKHGGAETSQEAYTKVDLTKARQEVFEAIRKRGATGATLHEIAEELGRPVNAISGRISELHHRYKHIRAQGTRNYQGHRGRVYVVVGHETDKGVLKMNKTSDESNKPKYWAKEAIGKPWIATDPDNPCHEWRATGRHCSRCPYDPVCNE